VSEPSERTATSCLRRWCPIAETYQDEDDPWCGWVHGDTEGHRLRLRRMLVCSECHQGYFRRNEWEEHECFAAY